MTAAETYRHRHGCHGAADWLWRCLFPCLLVCLFQPALAGPTPARGAFLVASEDMNDPNFSRTVILLISYGEEGAMGLVINRPTTILPRRIIPGVEGLSRYNGPMFFGGPVMLDRILFLWRGAEPAGESEPVFGGVRVSANRDVLDSLASEPTDASRLRIYAGYAGWAPGQLDLELRQGGWHVVAASEDLVFADKPGAVWKQLLPMAEPLTAALVP